MNLSSEKSLQLTSIPISPDRFRPYGQVIYPTSDSKTWDQTDAQLNINGGVPRFYIMTLLNVGMEFQQITQHQTCTQCLGAAAGKEWFIAVASSSIAAPDLKPEHLEVFQISGICFIKLEVGTWHSGPYFEDASLDFFNLELSDTNINDHHCVNLSHPIGIKRNNDLTLK